MSNAVALTCRRAGPRQRVIMSATLFTSEGAHNVRVRDLSESGARLISRYPINGATDVIFRRGALFAAARIIWARDCEAGVKFYRPLPAAEVAGTAGPA